MEGEQPNAYESRRWLMEMCQLRKFKGGWQKRHPPLKAIIVQ